MVAATPCMSGEWNACETSSAVTWISRSASFSDAALTPCELPEITVCFGWFRFAITTSAIGPSASPTTSAEAAALAIAPGSSRRRSTIARPRWATRRTVSSGVRNPAAPAAANSPRL